MKEAVEALNETREKLNQATDDYKSAAEPAQKQIDALTLSYRASTAPLMALSDELRRVLLNFMQKNDQYSIRYDFATVTRIVDAKPVVKNQDDVIEYLKSKGVADQYVGLTPLFFGSYLKVIAKEKTDVPGIDWEHSEHISFRPKTNEPDSEE